MPKTATVSAETAVIHHSGQGMRLQPGVYDVVDIDGAAARGELYIKDSGNGELLCADLYDPNITIKEAVKPADLKPGDRIDTEIGTLVVSIAPWSNVEEEPSVWDRVFVDVEVPEPGKFGDAARMLEVTAADEFSWLGLMPLRYRLAFRAGADVEVTR